MVYELGIQFTEGTEWLGQIGQVSSTIQAQFELELTLFELNIAVPLKNEWLVAWCGRQVACSTAVENTPPYQEDVGANPAGYWAFFLLLSFHTFLHQWNCS